MLSAERIQEIAAYFSHKAHYTFNNNALLIQALTRPSAKGIHVASDTPDFERLEFMGDRVLNLIITERLHELYPTASPGQLHQHYEKYTRNSDPNKRNGGPLYRVAKELQLEGFIIKSDDEDLEQHAVRGKLVSRHNKSKEGHLSDHVEAFIGAMYLDCDKNTHTVSEWVKLFWQHMGLNEDELSESSFGTSAVSNTAVGIQQNIKQDSMDSQLLAVATAGDFDKFIEILRDGGSVLRKDKDGRNVLHHFAMWGDERAIRYILISSPELDVNLVDNHQCTALYYAAERGRPSAVEFLLQYGATIHIKLKDGNVRSVYFQAAKLGHVPVMNLLLQYRWYSLVNTELEQCIEYLKDEGLASREPHVRKAITTQEQIKRMFEAAESIIHHVKPHSDEISEVKNAIKKGANVYAKNIEGTTILALLKSMDVGSRFDILAYILSVSKKLKLNEIDLIGICADATKEHLKAITIVYDQLVEIKSDNIDDDNIVDILDDWLKELSAAMKAPAQSNTNKPVTKSASLHFSDQGKSASSSSSSTAFSPGTGRKH